MRIVRLAVSVAALSCWSLAVSADAHGKPPAPPKVHAVVPPAHGNPHTQSRPTGNPHTASKPTGNPHTTTSAKPHPPKPAPTTVGQRIATHPELASRLKPLLPPGMTFETAASGFKNQGQFVAALHVSHNLNIPFAQLKAEMTGKDHDSLGRAIQELRPSADVKAEVRRAEREAKTDLKVVKHTDNDRDER